MTFNLRNANADDGVNSWRFRKDFLFRYLRESDADVICMQEVIPAVEEQMRQELSELYEFIGKGRLKEKNADDEINLIAFRRGKFSLLDSKHFWLSETPEVAGSKYPTQKFWPRTCTYIKLQCGAKEFAVFATHLDNADPIARERGFKLILQMAYQEKNAFICGDFNESPAKVSDWLPSDFVDYSVGLSDTYNGYGKESSKIDYIIGKGKIDCIGCVCDRIMRNDDYISDHFPVYAELILQN